MSEPDAPLPAEQLPVPLFDGYVLAARGSDGRIWLCLRDLCLLLSLHLEGQRRRIRANDTLHLTSFRVRAGRQSRVLDFLLLDDLPLWLLTVQTARVGAEVRRRIAYLKDYLVASVQLAFSQLTGLPPGASGQIEDLGQLDRVDTTLRALEERQGALEADQERERREREDLSALIAALHERVRQLEAETRSRLSEAQRGAIYHMVHAWGAARAARDAQLSEGAAVHACWRELNARFRVARYEDLPASRYDEILGFIKGQYRALTGGDIDAAEQGRLL
ncbi:MAG: N-terminal domain [Chloroflexota bacterium]|jgi:hypothetical protein